MTGRTTFLEYYAKDHNRESDAKSNPDANVWPEILSFADIVDRLTIGGDNILRNCALLGVAHVRGVEKLSNLSIANACAHICDCHVEIGGAVVCAYVSIRKNNAHYRYEGYYGFEAHVCYEILFE